MSLVGRRPFTLTSTGSRFARHDASVLWNYPSRSSISFLVCFGPCVSQSVQNVMRAFQRWSVLLATWPALMTHLRIIRMGFHMIFYVIFRYAGQSSRSVVLEAGKYYYVVGLQKGTESTDSLSAGVRLPSGRFMRPITKEILQWRLPGKFGLGLLKFLPCLTEQS